VVNAQTPSGARRGTPHADDGWGPATAVRSNAAAAPEGRDPYDPAAAGQDRYGAPAAGDPLSRLRRQAQERYRAQDRGLAGWAGLLVLLVIAGIGGAIDTVSGNQIRGGFNIGIVVASVVAILLVRRSAMFPIVIAPPIVYSLASAVMLYIRSGGLNDRRVLYDAAANWLVYGFPAIAAATAAVLIIAGIRLIVHR
jgi:hypothetical protein